MVSPTLLAGLTALTFTYFAVGLALYVGGVKRGNDTVASAGRGLASTAMAPAVAAAGSILLPGLLSGITTGVLVPVGLVALGVCVLGPPLWALVGVVGAKKNESG